MLFKVLPTCGQMFAVPLGEWDFGVVGIASQALGLGSGSLTVDYIYVVAIGKYTDTHTHARIQMKSIHKLLHIASCCAWRHSICAPLVKYCINIKFLFFRLWTFFTFIRWLFLL